MTVDTTYRAFGGEIGTDNTLSRQLGAWSSTLGVQTNFVASLGVQVYARTSGYWNFGDDRFGFLEAFPRIRSIAEGFTLPSA